MYCPNNQLCSEFQRLAEWTMRRINEADNYGLYFNEETITDSILLKLRKRVPQNFEINAYTKHEEGKGPHKTGADWEFRFSSNVKKSKDVILRVQAKKATSKERYKIDISQCKNLKKSAKKQRAWPIYVFYNWLPPSHLICKKSGCRSFPFVVEGCTFMPTDEITGDTRYSHQDSMTLVASKLKTLNPWHIIVCPCFSAPRGTKKYRRTLPEIVKNNLREALTDRVIDFDRWASDGNTFNADSDNEVKEYLNTHKLAGILHFSELREAGE